MKRFLPLVVALFVLAAPAAASATTFGAEVNADFTNQVRGIWSQSQAQSNLDGLYNAGGRVGRADSDWASVEPKAPAHGKHHFLWAYNDMIVSELAVAHLRWEPMLAFAPRWAEGHNSNVIHTRAGRAIAFLPPAKNANFAAYATAFMKRYGRHGAFWKANPKLHYEPVTTLEVWNEPDNLYDWGQHINLGAYARMYEAVRTAIHRVDRRARVMTGGLAWTESSLPRMLKAFRGMPIDALAIHPYANGATPKTTIKEARDALRIMRRYGRGGTPVAANEYGWTSIQNTYGSTAAKNVKPYAYAALIGLAKLHLSEIDPFMWSDPSWGLSTGAFAQAVAKIEHHRR